MVTKRPLHFEILNTLAWLSRKFGKHYCYPSQLKICEILEKEFGIKISLRTLNRHLRELERRGLFDRMRRIKTLPDGGLSIKSTIYFLKKAAFKYLARCMYLLKGCGIRLKEKARRLGHLGRQGSPPLKYLSTEEAKEFLSMALEKCNG